MNELAIRSIAGVAMIAIAILATVTGGYAFALLVAGVATAVYWEWMRMVRPWSFPWKIGGFFYALIPALALLWVRDRADNGLELVFWIFIVTWATDIGAYAAGRKIGGPKLATRISPNKTIAGLFGGMFAAGLGGALWAEYAGLGPHYFWLGAVMAFLAQGGDLFESWMKRRAGVKDSSNILPGHGGIFDRVDGLMVVAVAAAALSWVNLL
ncbi:phosphatidate cytidylyltransferase [Sphingomicrobium lutaoense]|uniref:Phosphatidate cytidylyltransferase n=1 Tax=Sphingomicrobium lutaoense TaxID=515949 RepID=A0A839YU78_9SPHN|nr:phosphatidate cytidylyltransferase [Sphingomicrobium lutaoense]MBB3763811.1 phosphatidate cytidylyltransferase [Sphingomicrobium lutaoense]